MISTKRLRLALVLICCAMVAAPVVGRPKKNFSVETLLEWRYAGDPVISPDGSKIAYTLRWVDKIEDKFYTNIWIVTSDGKRNRPLTQGKFSDSSPVWSPDGTRIAYVSDRSGKSQIHVRWLDADDDAVITDVLRGPGNIRWSPDGTQIAFTMFVPGNPEPGVKIPFKPVGAKWADPPIVVTKLRWRRDGSGYVSEGNTHIFLVPAIGGYSRQLTSGNWEDEGLEWTPDGRGILTAGDHTGDEYNLAGGEIWSVDVAAGEYKQLTQRKGPDTGPTPSPDGKLIAYTGFDFTGWSYSVNNLYVMNGDGSNPRLLSSALDRDVGGLRWSQDGKGIYLSVDSEGTTQLHFADLSGNIKPVTRGMHQLRGMTLAKNGQAAATLTAPFRPPDVVTFPLGDPGNIRQLTSLNDSLLAGYKFGKFEEIWYKAFDGRNIQGWIITPPDFDPARKYPLVLYIHGGPHAMYGVGFNESFQALAGSGYVVLYTNPRGSTGYGQEFGGLINRAYPKDDFQDLMAGVDELIKKDYIDDKKLCATGGSGGGCLTAWIIGHTDRFAAAVSQFPVTNWITQVGTADAGYYHGKMWMDGMPWENPQFYIERSPVFYAKNFKTPTMVLTGEEDFRTPMAESEELYLALRAMKVDTKLVRIPGEPHGASRNHVSHAIAKELFILEWFDTYTKKKMTN